MMSLNGVTELGYIGISVSDGPAWRAFGGEVLGLQPVDEGEDDRFYFRLDAWHHRIAVHLGGGDDLAYAGWRVADGAALAEIGRRLDALGVPYKAGTPADHVERRVLGLIRTESPGGIPTEVFYGPQVDYHKPFHPGRPMYGRFGTDGGLGHIVIREPDVDAALSFYRNGLGLVGGSDYVLVGPKHRLSIQFLHAANSRQHSVAFGVPFPGDKRLHHFMVECLSVDDVGQGLDLVRECQIPVRMELGKHANDQMLSFYMDSPSAFQVEYGWGGRSPLAEAEYSIADMWGRAEVLRRPRPAPPPGDPA